MWPCARQTLLLQAALSERETAAQAFLDWCAVTDFEGSIDGESYRLLPLAHANLEGAAVDIPMLPLIAGVRRQAWVRSRLQMRWAEAALAVLRDGGIPVMLIKGLALATTCYADVSLRPMIDVDVLVPVDAVPDALAILARAGLAPDPANPVSALGLGRGRPHAVELCGPAGAKLDLHCRPLTGAVEADEERWLWDAAIPASLGDIQLLRPAPTALLTYSMIHGIWSHVHNPIRWIPDALLLLRREGQTIDWDRLIAVASRYHLLARVGAALLFLDRNFSAELPPDVARRLGRARPTFFERIEGGGLCPGERRPLGSGTRMRYRASLAARLLLDGRARELPVMAERFLANRLKRLWPGS